MHAHTTLVALVVLVHMFPCGGALNLPATLNYRPVIGIPTQEFDNLTMGAHYLAASYVKFVEQAGARVVPLHYDYDAKTLLGILEQINGVLIPGGHLTVERGSRIEQFMSRIVRYAMSANDNGDYFPLWGTCLGFELITTIMTDDFEILTRCSAENMALNLQFTKDAPTSRLFRHAPASVIDALAVREITYNNHKFCITARNFAAHPKLSSMFTAISTNYDSKGIEFVSTLEAKSYPFYGVQFHPEKPQFEWNPTKAFDHSNGAIASMQYLANFFVSEARKSAHKFASEEAEFSALIYNDAPRLVHSYRMLDVFVQLYLWTKKDAQRRKIYGSAAMVDEGTAVHENSTAITRAVA